MRAIAAGITDVGKERDHNEDRFVLLPEFGVFVVADGMGGHQCGEVASRMATSTIASFFRGRREISADGVLSDILQASLLEANSRIHRRAVASPIHRGMGTTVVAAAFHRIQDRLAVAHAGDSRCYRMRDGKLVRLTRDHSLVEEAIRSRPDISPSELAYLPPNVITRALGVEPVLDVEVVEQQVELGDMFLLCSDGLHGFAPEGRIAEIMANASVLTSACAALVDEANDHGGGDNITAVLIRFEELDEPWAVSTSVPPPPTEPIEEPPPESTAAPLVPDIAVPGAMVTTNDAARELADSELEAAEARALLEAEDTAKMMAITDADAILASHARKQAAQAAADEEIDIDEPTMDGELEDEEDLEGDPDD